MEKHPPGIYSCFFPLLPLLKLLCLVLPSSAEPSQAGWCTGMGAGLGEVGNSPLPCRVHLSPVLLHPGFLGKLCCFGTGKGGTGKQDYGPSQQPQVLASPGAPPCSWPCSVLRQTLQEVLRAVLISHPHLGTVASAPAAAPSEATPSARAGWDCPCCSWPCPGAPQHPAIALKLLGAPGFPQLAAPTILSAW